MLNKNTIDAYHKITAPEGLRERIEGAVRGGQTVKPDRRTRLSGRVWIPAAALAAAAVCLTVIAVRPGSTDRGPSEMRMNKQPEMQLMPEN